MSGFFDAVQQHVHAADAEHRVVEVEAVEHAVVEMLSAGGVPQNLRMPLSEMFTGCDEKSARAARRVANHVRRGRLHHLDHQADDVPGRPELPVLPSRRNLAEHVFVEVALRVPVVHRHVVDHVHDLRQQRRSRNREPSVLHVMGVGRVVAAKGPQEREDVVADHREHLRWREILEPRPPQVFVGTTLRVCTFGEDSSLDGLLQPSGFVLFQRVQVVQSFQEQQIRDLLDDFQRVRDAARPEGVPDGVDLAADVACEHDRAGPSLFSPAPYRVRRTEHPRCALPLKAAQSAAARVDFRRGSWERCRRPA